jgi:hypothetical protein
MQRGLLQMIIDPFLQLLPLTSDHKIRKNEFLAQAASPQSSASKLHCPGQACPARAALTS